MLQERRQSLVHQGYLLIHGRHHRRAGEVESVAKIQLEAGRNRGLLNTGWHARLGQLTVLVAVHHRIVPLVPPRNFTGLPLHAGNVLHADVRPAPSRLDLHLLHHLLLGLLADLAEGLLHLTLHLILEILYVLRHLGVLRHEVVLLRQLGQVVVLQLIGGLTAAQLVLLLAEDGTCRMFRYVGHQSIQFGECLIAGVTMVMVFTFQLAERPATALLRSVEGVGRGRAGRWKNGGFCNGEIDPR